MLYHGLFIFLLSILQASLALAKPIDLLVSNRLGVSHADQSVQDEALAIAAKNERSHDYRTGATSQTTTGLQRRRLVARASSSDDFDLNAFNKEVADACARAIQDSNRDARNPSGIVACYNVALGDMANGIFMTDVRLYQKSPQRGDFVGAAPADFGVAMNIPNAVLSAPQMMGNPPKEAPPARGQFLAGFQNVGRLSDDLDVSKLTNEDLRVLLIPNLSISTVNQDSGQITNTTLSSDILSYVAGHLAQPNGTPSTITLEEARTRAEAVISAVSEFQLPGTRIQVYPVGLIITMIWTGIFVLVVGGGTIGRYQFRQAYRRRVQRAQTLKLDRWK